VDAGKVPARQVMPPLTGNARQMAGLSDGFIKLFCRPASGQMSVAWWWHRRPAS
jgi:dihydrolipoamide dehydrogenase